MCHSHSSGESSGDDPVPQIISADWPESSSRKIHGSGTLYCGDAGSENWLAVTRESSYPLNAADPFSLRTLRKQAICGRSHDSLVSFGPGDGINDLDLLHSMAEFRLDKFRKITYVPIDISESLLQVAVATIGKSANIPFALRCDFEQDGEFIFSLIEPHCRGPTLYSMLGGTFANLSAGERTFLGWLRATMSSQDVLILDVPTACQAWEPETEPRLQAKSYSEVFRRFLAYGIAQQDHRTQVPTEERADRIQANFYQHVRFYHKTNEDTFAEEISVVDSETGYTVLIFRRYRFSLLVQWLTSQGFEVTFAEESSHSIADRFGMGVIALKKPTATVHE